jgi:hypothetical protein
MALAIERLISYTRKRTRMAGIQDELAELDEAWDEDPAQTLAYSMAPELGDLDDGWGDDPPPPARGQRPRAPKPAVAKREPALAPPSFRATKQQRRDFEKQQRREAKQRESERKRARKLARRDEADQRAAARRHEPKVTPTRAPRVDRVATGELPPRSSQSPAVREAPRAPEQRDPAHKPTHSRTEQSRKEQSTRRRSPVARSERLKRKLGPLAPYLVLAAILTALIAWATIR